MTSLIKDTESRNRIVSDINTNFFVEAGAGSGKTTMLVNRMVAMVEAGIDISKISAITFTKAAAGEFYERFQTILIERSNPDYVWEDKGYAGQLPQPTELTRQRCANALQNIDLCFMGTIDSFCNMILSEHPSEAGILSDSSLITDADLNVIFRQVYVKICNGGCGDELMALATAFRAVNRHDEDVFCRGMNLFMTRRNVHFNYDADKVTDIDEALASYRDELIRLVEFLIDHKELQYDGGLDWSVLPEYLRVLKRKWSSNFSNILWTIKNLKDIAVIPQAMDLYPLELEGYFEEPAPRKRRLACTICNEEGLYKKVQSSQYDVSVAFLGKCVPEIEKIMHDSGYLTYFDYLYYLRNMLRRDAEAEGKLIRYIYDRHSYFLIDEFQDTNPMQAEVFFYLSSENPVGNWKHCKPRDGSLFIVGDPKQSIYRFRNADVTSFLKVKSLFVKSGGDILELSRNFRSKKCLCEYFNSIFTGLLPEETMNQSKYEAIPVPEEISDEFAGIYKYTMNKKTDDPSWVGDIVRGLVDNEKFKIRGKNDKEPRMIKFNDIMIITYNKTNLAGLMEQFDLLHVPVRVEGQVLFSTNEALWESYKIYSVIADPDDKLALYGALLDKPVALTKEELLEYRSCGGILSLTAEFYTDNCDNETVNKVASKIRYLREVQQKTQNMSPAALLAYIIDRFKIFNTAEVKNIEVVYYTLELMRNAEKSGIVVTLQDGKAYLSELLSGTSEIERCLSLNDNEDSVHMANLHKVKGLEAPIIILDVAQTGNNIPSIRVEYNEESTEGYLFALNKENKTEGNYFSTIAYSDKKTLEGEAMAAEDIRKIYVAATRTRNALIICDHGAGRNRWKPLNPDEMPYIFDIIKHEDIKGREMSDFADPSELYEQAEAQSILKNRDIENKSFKMENPSRLGVLSKLSVDKDAVVSDETVEVEAHPFAALTGTMVHKLMEILVSAGNKVDLAKTVDEVISEFRTARMITYEDSIRSSLNGVASVITSGGYAQSNGLPQDILKTLLAADEVYCEVPFCYKETSDDGDVIWNGVMDVVYRSGASWHIVDYKTNADGNDLDKKYQKQLNAYVKAFKEITGNDADALTYHIDV